MRKRDQLAWKLSAVVLAIVTVAILTAGLLSGFISRQYALDAARDVMEFNSASIRSGIEELMLSFNHAGVADYIADMSRRSSAYHDISLISHTTKRIAVSGLRVPGTVLEMTDSPCNMCHVSDDPPIATNESKDAVLRGSGGGRVLLVVTPILNQSGCRSADCHTHAESGPVLGLLRTEYSLAGFDARMSKLSWLLALVALLAVGLCFGTLLILFRRLLAGPLRRMVAGIDTLADGDWKFRFSVRRKDEIGLVEDSFNDMAEQIQSHQAELQRAREYAEGIVENTEDLIITVNTQGLIQSFNRGAERALGYARGEVLGQKVEMLFADPRERDTAIARLNEQDAVTNWETRFKTKDGQICYVLLTLSRLRNRSGELIGTMGISKDITIEKELQRKLIRTEQEAAIGRAVTAIQHAVKNMLNTLRGGLYVARVGLKKNQRERIVEGCEMIEEGLARISDLSLDMLKYVREWKIEAEPVDLADLVEKIKVAVSQTAAERSLSIRTEVDNSLPTVSCDPSLIHMCLMDIVSNAMDACEVKDYHESEQPGIVLRASRNADGDCAVVEIQDNGIGMSREIAENVFTPFFSTKKKWGTGLGLALTSRIIGLHDGSIAVESEPGKGAVFRITLPFGAQRNEQGTGNE